MDSHLLSHAHKQSARERYKRCILNIISDRGNNLHSSFTIPNWEYARLRKAVLKLRKSEIKISWQKLALMCSKYLLQKMYRKKCQIRRTRRRNSSVYSYQKISVRWSPEEYNILHAQSNHLKVSVSLMIDIAVGMYLQYVVWVLMNPEKKLRRNSPLNKDIVVHLKATFGIYQRNTEISRPRHLKFTEYYHSALI